MIRQAEPDDIDEVYELWYELMQYHQGFHPVFAVNLKEVQAQREELMGRIRDKNTRIFLFEEESELLGMIIVNFRNSTVAFKLHKKGYIAETLIREKYRSKGVGKELFEAAKKWLLDMGADHIEAQVALENPGAIRFWQAQGFTPSTQHIVLVLDAKKKKE